MRGRKPVPTRLKQLRGSPRYVHKNDQREIRPGPARHETEIRLTGLEQKIYDRKYVSLSSIGVLTEADHDLFVFYVQAIALLHTIQESLMENTTDGQSRKLPDKHTFVMIRDLTALINRLAGEFGETASARAKISATGPNPAPVKTIKLYGPEDPPKKGA